MKKLVIAKTGEEVELGDVIRGVKNYETSFGSIKSVETIKVTLNNLDNLIKRGIIKYNEEPKMEDSENLNIVSEDDHIGFYVKLLSNRYKKSERETIDWLNATNKIYPKAVLDLLLQEIALYFYNIDTEGFDKAEEYFSIRPKDGKVGRVTHVTKYIPLFKSAEDADKARKLLKKQLEYMYGE